jgi:hypothetical protein
MDGGDATPSSPVFGPKAGTIPATEHRSLLGTGSVAWHEASSRTNTPFATLGRQADDR